MSVTISEIGGTIVSLTAPDRDGNLADVVLGFDRCFTWTHACSVAKAPPAPPPPSLPRRSLSLISAAAPARPRLCPSRRLRAPMRIRNDEQPHLCYLLLAICAHPHVLTSVDSYTVPGPYFGAIVGRVANRIAGGKFVLDGEEYTLATNNGPNCLHGGNVGFDKLRWSGVEVPGGVELTLTSPDGDEGFPGTVVVVATYTLETGGKVLLDMSATSDAPTPIALAQHSYFNLRGHDAGASVHGHTVRHRSRRPSQSGPLQARGPSPTPRDLFIL